ncbi:cytochrome d ubiquinol oxidase subunit II [Streptomyces sp. NPDC002992]|uniref:cytochrome d ubiquinol oxidase subunit II n=1 Tax=Streptomyces sp. NPDC002992 TaxID=3154273 RepID=UPI0033A4A21C
MISLESLAIALLAFFATGYFVLAGADIGTGMLTPYLGRTDHERRLVIASFAPFFLGNEVWLVATAGVLVGCFPDLEGELMTGQFTVLLPLLAGWIVRDIGLWSRGRGRGRVWRAVCDAAVVCGSWTVALAWGPLLAALLVGTPYKPATGPTALLASLASAALFAAHGLGFATLRLTGLPYERARLLVGRTGRPWQSFALTAVLLGVLPLLAGTALPLTERAADGATLTLLVPALLGVTPLLVAAQVWTWRTFRHRVTRPSYL